MENQTTGFDHILWAETITLLHERMGPYLASILSCNSELITKWETIETRASVRLPGPTMEQFVTVCRLAGVLSPAEFFFIRIRTEGEYGE